jgi:hypothetical protein
MATQPRLATWQLRHFGCSPNNEAILGDLDERYREGRSAAWWRQAAESIVTSLFQEVSRPQTANRVGDVYRMDGHLLDLALRLNADKGVVTEPGRLAEILAFWCYRHRDNC